MPITLRSTWNANDKKMEKSIYYIANGVRNIAALDAHEKCKSKSQQQKQFHILFQN